MTPEEKAVIDAAIAYAGQDLSVRLLTVLVDATKELIFACPQCNAGGHTCPGDGNPISHTGTGCGEHDEPTYQQWVKGNADASTYPCWECLVDPTEDPAPWCDCRPEDFSDPSATHPNSPCRLRAHIPTRCLNRPEEAEHKSHYGATCACGRPLGHTTNTGPYCGSPEAPHNSASVVPYDVAVAGETLALTEVTDIPVVPATIASQPIVSTEEVSPFPPAWIPTTMTNCLTNDRIRIGTEQATVIRSNHGLWHADNRDPWHPRNWDHIELRMELDILPGFNQYPPETAVEMLCSAERLAVLRMQEAFPGSAITSSHVD